MNGDVEELVREGLDRLTADVQVPAEMVARARTRVRRRKIAARAALACGTAAVTAAAVIAATGVGAPRSFITVTTASPMPRLVITAPRSSYALVG